ncbi:copper chaperone NosL [Arcicella rosea]|uniref:nitrous oxide reductase accessory protein NosL n=1 Tax=Arcicella TaxID=217140 RepID=UPI00285FF342|nr:MULTISPECIES: nitrous oxide reductase accessory protein NosL [unclassified Arcicella]MDR6563770.1 copper chaperone NosL [Arcicella sp. BE51]MDR6813546.1 copper chaperone NosL [Arcicella sp. BE140]MDR6824859.1 copper chaperone NosL [Arcicella sp. BE139]
MKFSIIILLCIGIAMSACTTQTEPIYYGKDNCGLCKMTIMDSKYATELVTPKGKVFKFDDLRCMVIFMKTNHTSSADYAHLVVNNFDNPQEFINVTEGTFGQGTLFRSPMRGDLAAFKSPQFSQKLKEKDATIKFFSWTQIQEMFN